MNYVGVCKGVDVCVNVITVTEEKSFFFDVLFYATHAVTYIRA